MNFRELWRSFANPCSRNFAKVCDLRFANYREHVRETSRPSRTLAKYGEVSRSMAKYREVSRTPIRELSRTIAKFRELSRTFANHFANFRELSRSFANIRELSRTHVRKSRFFTPKTYFGSPCTHFRPLGRHPAKTNHVIPC